MTTTELVALTKVLQTIILSEPCPASCSETAGVMKEKV